MIEINTKRTVMGLKGIFGRKRAISLAEHQGFFDNFQCVSYIDLSSDEAFARRAVVARAPNLRVQFDTLASS